MKLQHMLVMAIVAMFSFTVLAEDVVKPAVEPVKPVVKEQTLCPITGKKIDKAVFVDAENVRIYCCCKDCIEKVKADPKAAIKKITDAGETCAPIPKDAPKPPEKAPEKAPAPAKE
jgi:hypothetical protein